MVWWFARQQVGIDRRPQKARRRLHDPSGGAVLCQSVFCTTELSDGDTARLFQADKRWAFWDNLPRPNDQGDAEDRVVVRAAAVNCDSRIQRDVSGVSAAKAEIGKGRFSFFQSRSGGLYLLLVIIIADALQYTDPDLWGHIYFGQVVLREHRVVLHDAVSYSAFGQLYRNHEWLTELLMALIYNHWGIIGLKLWKFACVAATLVCVALALAETGANRSVQSNVLGVVAIAIMPQMQFRPQLYTFIFAAALLALLARHNYRGRAPLWLVVPIMILWANLHGGFAIGIAMLGAYAGVAGLQDLIAGAGFARPFKLALMVLAGTLATLLTPWGIGLWYLVGHALFASNIHVIIVDWMPLTAALTRQWHSNHLGVIFYACVIGLMVGFAVTFALTPRRGRDLPLVAIAAMMSWAAFSAVRNMPLAAIACAVPLARHAELLAVRWRKVSAEEGGSPAVSGGVQAGALLPVGVALVLVLVLGLFSPRLAQDHPYPAGAVAYLREHRLSGNVLGDFGWGQYLIWHLAPDSKVFIDGRYDTVFPTKVINDYLRFYFDWPGAAAVLSAYPHDFVLIPPNAPAYALMSRTRGWKLVYRDADSCLFARADKALPAITVAPVSGAAEVVRYFP
jgi:hypothetical protein